MEYLNIELLEKALNSRKKELLILRKRYEHELHDYCTSDNIDDLSENYKMLKDSIDSITEELIDIIEQLDILNNLK